MEGSDSTVSSQQDKLGFVAWKQHPQDGTFFYELPRLPTATMEVRRITIGGNFFGGEFGYLDVEAEACIEIKKSNTCLDMLQRIF